MTITGKPRESWLKSEVPEKFAEAMMKCQHLGAYCGQDGFCHFGDCFVASDDEETLRKAVKVLLRLADNIGTES